MAKQKDEEEGNCSLRKVIKGQDFYSPQLEGGCCKDLDGYDIKAC